MQVPFNSGQPMHFRLLSVEVLDRSSFGLVVIERVLNLC